MAGMGRPRCAPRLARATCPPRSRAIAVPLAVDAASTELAPDQVVGPPAALARPHGALAALLSPGGQALLAHQGRHRVLVSAVGFGSRVGGGRFTRLKLPVTPAAAQGGAS